MAITITFQKPTQMCWACGALIAGRTISQIDGIREAKGWGLGSIICTLRSQYQWPIIVEYSGPSRVAFYSLAPGTDIESLCFPKSASDLAEKCGSQ